MLPPSLVVTLVCCFSFCFFIVSAVEYHVIECHDLRSLAECHEYTGCRWRRKTQDCFDMQEIWTARGQMVDIDELPMDKDEYGGINLRPTELRTSSQDLPDDQIDTSTIVVIPNCISEAVVQSILALQSHLDNTTLVQDRSDNLVFSHVVHRIESMLKSEKPKVHAGLIALMLRMDIWKITKEPMDGIDEAAPEQLFPEIEYLTYEASKTPGFAPHKDNGSLITAIFMLSDRKNRDFRGGQLVFDKNRKLRLDQGDCVIFRGEELIHQVKPITSGKRIVLQIELHGSHQSEGEDDGDGEYDDNEEEEDDEVLYSL